MRPHIQQRPSPLAIGRQARYRHRLPLVPASPDYLDRNHGSILILWDRLFGTFEEEDEPVVYGLTANIESDSPVRIATHEWADIAADVAAADSWHARWSFLLRRPGWAYARRAAAGVA